jgi:hypothetical protein
MIDHRTIKHEPIGGLVRPRGKKSPSNRNRCDGLQCFIHNGENDLHRHLYGDFSRSQLHGLVVDSDDLQQVAVGHTRLYLRIDKGVESPDASAAGDGTAVQLMRFAEGTIDSLCLSEQIIAKNIDFVSNFPVKPDALIAPGGIKIEQGNRGRLTAAGDSIDIQRDGAIPGQHSAVVARPGAGGQGD